jgi:hypothetical protein
MKAAPLLRNRSIKQPKKTSLMDLQIRFLELQELRKKVKFAECGRLVAPPHGASVQSSDPSTGHEREYGAGRH